MPNLSLNYQSGIVNQLFFNKPIASPTGIYIGLSSGVPTNVNNGGEFNVGNYSRVSIGTGTNVWSFNLNSGLLYNNNQINFPVAASYWGWTSGIILYDGFYPGANAIFWDALSTPKELGQYDQYYCPVSGLSIQIH